MGQEEVAYCEPDHLDVCALQTQLCFFFGVFSVKMNAHSCSFKCQE